MASAQRVESAVVPQPAPRWSAATRVAFRFSVVYLCLTIFSTQLFSAVFMLPSPRFLTGVNDLLAWVATRVFQVRGPIPVEFTGSGDTLLNWVLTGTMLILAGCVAVVWSLVSTRDSYPRMNMWFRLLVRFALGATLVRYGFGKLIPAQMPTVFLDRLVEPFGNFSPMGVLWSSIGASPAYEMCVGAVELIPGILLFLPQTTLLGALLALMATTGVFVLNMTYDVPAKLLSFHLVLMSLLLLAPYGRNLRDLLLLNRPLVPTHEPPIGRTPPRRRHWVVAQMTYGALIVLLAIAAALSLWSRTGPNAEKSPLFGIWDVQQMIVDGDVRPPLLTDTTRWRRVIMQGPTAAVFQKMDDSFERYTTEFDTDGKTLTITPVSGTGASTVTYHQLSPDLLVIDGTIDGRVVRLELRPRDLNSFVLNSRGFNWVQDVPFNR